MWNYKKLRIFSYFGHMHHVGTYCRNMGILHFFFQILANLWPNFPQKPFVCTKIISSKKNANIDTQKNIIAYKLTTKWRCDHVFIISIYCVVWGFNIAKPYKTFLFGSPCIMCNEISIVI